MIWKRYFLKEFMKMLALFLAGFYFLYVLIDYSSHTKSFHQEGFGISHVLLYYIFQFSLQAEVLLPVALLISIVKVLTSLNTRNEIVALVSAGVPMKTLLRPFLLTALFFAALLYVNFQWLQPQAVASLQTLEAIYFQDKESKQPIGALPLTDNSLLLYQKYDPQKETFLGAYWVRNPDLIYRIDKLTVDLPYPKGQGIDILERVGGEITRTKNFDEYFFPEMILEKETLFEAAHPPEGQSLSHLFTNLRWKGPLSDREAQSAAIFFYKAFIPLTCLLAILGPAPFCVRFTRQLPVFLIYALSLFGVITFFTFVNSCVILGESQVIPPFWGICIPLVLFLTPFGLRYGKL